MFGKDKRIQELESRLARMESQLGERVEREVERRMTLERSRFDAALQRITARFEQAPEERTRYLLNDIGDALRGELEATIERLRRAETALDTLESFTGAPARTLPTRHEANTVYRAGEIGLVTAWRQRNTLPCHIIILVGWENPPDHFAGEVNTTYSPTALFTATVVRSGQLWRVKGEGVHVLYTPIL